MQPSAGDAASAVGALVLLEGMREECKPPVHAETGDALIAAERFKRSERAVRDIAAWRCDLVTAPHGAMSFSRYARNPDLGDRSDESNDDAGADFRTEPRGTLHYVRGMEGQVKVDASCISTIHCVCP